MKVNKSACTQEVFGSIIELQFKGQDFPTLISVEYQVDGTRYVVTESIKLKSEMIKFGFLPVGQRKVPVMEDTTVGSAAMVNYNPSDPAEAFITNNIGKANI